MFIGWRVLQVSKNLWRNPVKKSKTKIRISVSNAVPTALKIPMFIIPFAKPISFFTNRDAAMNQTAMTIACASPTAVSVVNLTIWKQFYQQNN